MRSNSHHCAWAICAASHNTGAANGGHSSNSVTTGVRGATIGGGGEDFSPSTNRVTDDYGTVGGGVNNRAGDGVGEVRVYNAADGAVVWKMPVPEGGIYTVDFNHDGSILAAGGFDGDVRLYKATDGTLIKRFTPVELTGAAVAAK